MSERTLEERLQELEERERVERERLAGVRYEAEELITMKEQGEVLEEDDGFWNNTWEITGSAVEKATEEVLKTLGDISAGIMGGEDAVRSGPQFVLGDTEFVDPEGINEGIPIPFTNKRLDFVQADDFKTLEDNFRERTGKRSLTLSDLDLPDVDRPDSGLGQAASSILQWGIVFAATRKVTGFSGVAGFTANAAIADFAAFDPLEARASDLAVTLGEDTIFDNALTQYLAHDEDDENLEGRLKNSIEGLVLGGIIAVGAKATKAAAGPMVDQTLEMFKWLKSYRRAKTNLAADDAVRASVKAAPEQVSPLAPLGQEIISTSTEALSVAGRAKPGPALKAGSLSDEALESAASGPRQADTVGEEADRGFILDDAGEFSTSSETSRFTIASTGTRHRVSPKDETLDAFMELRETDEAIEVIFPFVVKDARGLQFGIEMYEEAAALALHKGKSFVSDSTLSIQANRVWKSLEKRGYVLERNPTAPKTPVKGTADFKSADGNPIYKVVGKVTSTLDEAGERVVREAGTKQAASAILRRVRGEGVEAGAEGTSRSNLIDPARVEWESFGATKGDLLDLVTKVTQLNKKLLDAAGEAVTMKDVQAMAVRLAKESGEDPVAIQKALTLTGSPADVAARQSALMNLLDSSANHVSDLARAVKSGEGGFEARKLLHIQLTRHNYLKALAKGNAPEAARFMRQQRELVKASKTNDEMFREIIRDIGQDIDDPRLVDVLSKHTSVEAISREAASLIPGKTSSRFFQYWYAQLLSNPASWVANTLGPAWNLAFGSLVELPMQAVIGAARGTAGRVTLGEVAANYMGAVIGVKQTFRFPLKHYFGTQKGLNKVNPKEFAAYVREHEEQVGTLYRTITTGEAQTRATTKFGVDRMDASFEKFRELPPEMFDEMNLRRKAMHGMHYMADRLGLTALGNFGLKALKVPGGIFATTDEFFNTIAYHQKYNQELFRIVNREVADKIAEGTLKATKQSQKEYIQKRMTRLSERFPTGHPQAGQLVDDYGRALSNQITKSADKHAAYVTFQSVLGPKVKPLLDMTSNNPQLRIFVPFIRTPTNIYKQAFIERTPWPWIKALGSKQQRVLLKGGREADEMIARASMGSLTMATAATYWASGNITGSRTDGLNSEDFDNVAQYSIKFGDTWYRYDRLEPLGMLIGLTADIMEAGSRLINEPKSEANDAWYEQLEILASGTLMAGVENMFSKVYLQGIADLVGIMSGDDYAVDRVKGSLGYSLLIPGGAGLRAVGSATDPWAREAFDFWDKIQSQIPLAREQLPIRRDFFGDKVPTPSRAVSSFGSPVIISTESDDPMRVELARLKFPINLPSKTVRSVPLTTEEYTKLLEIRGQHKFNGTSMEEYIREYVASPEYRHESLSDAGRIKAVLTIVERYGSAAREKLINDSPDLQQRIRDLKVNQARALFTPDESQPTDIEPKRLDEIRDDFGIQQQ